MKRSDPLRWVSKIVMITIERLDILGRPVGTEYPGVRSGGFDSADHAGITSCFMNLSLCLIG